MAPHVYFLRFGNTTDLRRAFDRILDSPDVDSCIVEAEETRVRFFAPPAPAEKLIESIYEDGGLTWCSRHRLEKLPETP